MRQVTAGLAIMALTVTGCAAAASTSSKAPAAVASQSAATAAGGGGLSGVSSGGSAGPAQWVVDGTFATKSGSGQPLSGTVTFRDAATGQSASVTVSASGKFTLGLIAGTYTATPRTKAAGSPCSAPVTVTVKAGKQTQLALVCPAS